MKKILVIDDDRLDRRIITKAAAGKEFNVLEAQNGLQGFQIAQANPDLDLIITDVIMPELDGRDLVRKVRSDQVLKHIPIIIVSSYIKLNQIVDLLENGASRFIPKPINLSLLSDYIELLTKNSCGTVHKFYLETELVLDRIGNDHDLYVELLNLFIEDVDQRKRELACAVNEKNISDIRINSHSLKSALNNIGAMSIASQALAIERQAMTGEFGNSAELFNQIELSLSDLCKEITGYLSAHRPNSTNEAGLSH